MPALTELRMLVDCELHQWEYKADKASICIDSYRRFQKWMKGAKTYALVEVNHLLQASYSLASQPISDLPDCLKSYADIFSTDNAEKLVPYRDIDLAIELQPGKEPLYRPIYSLLP